MEKYLFNLFLDTKQDAIEKIANYFKLNPQQVSEAITYGCTSASFIDKFKIDLNKYDSSILHFICRHVTTSNDEEIESFFSEGLLNLKDVLQFDTPLSKFLQRYKIVIDVDERKIIYKGHTYPIDSNKNENHKCFRGNERICSWYSGCESFQKISSLYHKLYRMDATLEFFLAGTLDEMLDYSIVSKCPEILDTIDQIIHSLNGGLGQCGYPLCHSWIRSHGKCYIVEFESAITKMETYNPTNYDRAYEELEENFKWSNISYYDYYERRISKQVYDNLFFINKIIDVYGYYSTEQFGSLNAGVSIDNTKMKIYQVHNETLLEVK